MTPNMSLLFAMLLGSLMVVQPTLNRLMLDIKGLSVASLINGTVVFALACFAFIIVNFQFMSTPALFRAKESGTFHWWFLLPGICGFLIIFISPMLIRELGAFTTVLALICGQIVTSLLLDATTQGIAITTPRLAGLALAVAGAYMSFRPPT